MYEGTVVVVVPAVLVAVFLGILVVLAVRRWLFAPVQELEDEVARLEERVDELEDGEEGER